MKRLLFILFLLLAIMPVPAFALTNNYTIYVSDDAQGNAAGTDANCTNPALAHNTTIKTIDCVNQLLDSIVDDTDITFKFDRGDDWEITDAQKCLGYDNTGTPVDYPTSTVGINLTFDAYGSGDKPNIYASVNCPGGSYLWAVFLINDADVDDVTIQNLAFDGEGGSVISGGVQLREISGDIDFNNNHIDWNGSDNVGDSNDAMTCGFHYKWTTAPTGNITIHDNEIFDCYDGGSDPAREDAHGIHLGKIGGADKTAGTVTIYNNHIYKVNGDAIQLQNMVPSGGGSVSVYKNILHEYGEQALDLKGSGNIKFYQNKMWRAIPPATWWADCDDQPLDPTYPNCSSNGASLVWSETQPGSTTYIYHNYFGPNPRTGAINANLDPTQSVYITGNYFEDNPQIVKNNNGNLYLYNNVSKNDLYGNEHNLQPGQPNQSTNNTIWFATGTDTAYLYNNTIWHGNSNVNDSSNGIIRIDAGTITAKNNVFYQDYEASVPYIVDCSSGVTVTLDANLYYDANQGTPKTSLIDAVCSATDSNEVVEVPEWTFPKPTANGNLTDAGTSDLGNVDVANCVSVEPWNVACALNWDQWDWANLTTITITSAYFRDRDDKSPWTMGAAAELCTPVAPSITDPTPSETGVELDRQVDSSAFADQSGCSTSHVSSDWEVCDDINCVQVAKSTYNDTTNKITWTPTLSPNSQLYIRVRHTNSNGDSAWSTPVYFETVGSPPPSGNIGLRVAVANFTAKWIIIDCEGQEATGIKWAAGATGGLLYNSTIVNCGTAGLDADESVTARFDLFRQNAGPDLDIDTGKTVTASYNSIQDSAKTGSGTYSSTTSDFSKPDPYFWNKSGDYRIGTGSHCVDIGPSIYSGIEQDITGKEITKEDGSIIHGSALDCGAYQVYPRVMNLKALPMPIPTK